MNKKAVVLLSGGLDSTTTLYVARNEGFDCFTVSFDYGQRHHFELQMAEKQSRKAGAREHLQIQIDPAIFSGSALVDRSLTVPEHQFSQAGIPVTYVPGRNILFLAHALSLAESRNCSVIFTGANVLDYSGYPDCRPEFFSAFAHMARLGTRAGEEGDPVEIRSPLIALNKKEIIELGLTLGVDYSLTSSCYNPDEQGQPCGKCDSCHFRARGFQEANRIDPILA
ncbi:MAG: 7-cyano-7-deazaguanine synthase QueC [Spirochaetales bacterium]|nr:7-cyano-7-deazaguanine synthase QueC [Spirochaetales bacterium]